MNSPFGDIARTENLKREIRAAVEAAAREAMQDSALTPATIAARLVSYANYISMSWLTPGEETLAKLAEGRISTDEELLRLTGNRNLSSGSSKPR